MFLDMYLILPETQGKTLAELSQMYSHWMAEVILYRAGSRTPSIGQNFH